MYVASSLHNRRFVKYITSICHTSNCVGLKSNPVMLKCIRSADDYQLLCLTYRFNLIAL